MCTYTNIYFCRFTLAEKQKIHKHAPREKLNFLKAELER